MTSGPALPVTPGTYALVLRCRRAGSVRIGALGTLRLRPGWYVYVGRACGPGGIRARIGHHLGRTERPRWHIDYLRARLPIACVWYCAARCEHQWAAGIAGMPGAEIPLPGFGSSDCGCGAHLVYFGVVPSDAAALRQASICSEPGILCSRVLAIQRRKHPGRDGLDLERQRRTDVVAGLHDQRSRPRP